MGLFGFGKKKEATPPPLPSFANNSLDNPSSSELQPSSSSSMDPSAFSSSLDAQQTGSQPSSQEVSGQPSVPASNPASSMEQAQTPVPVEGKPFDFTQDIPDAPEPVSAPLPESQLSSSSAQPAAQVNPFVAPPVDNPSAKQAPDAPDSFDLPDISEDDIAPTPVANPEPVSDNVSESMPELAQQVVPQTESLSKQSLPELEPEPMPVPQDPPAQQAPAQVESQPVLQQEQPVDDEFDSSDVDDLPQPTPPQLSQSVPVQDSSADTFAPSADDSQEEHTSDEDITPIVPDEQESFSPASDTTFSSSVPVQPEQEESGDVVEDLKPIEERVVVTSQSGKTDIFVEKKAYQQALLSLAEIESDIAKASDHIGRVIDDEGIVTAKIAEWHDVMNDIQAKLISTDSKIFDKGENHD